MKKLFSRRQAEQNGLITDVFVYEKFPQEFRNQVFYILSDVANLRIFQHEEFWKALRNAFIREKGWKHLSNCGNNGKYECEMFFLNSDDQNFLDYLDFAFAFIDTNLSKYRSFNLDIEKAISELNGRLKYHNLGYEFVSGELIRIDNSVLHQTVVKPALHLLSNLHFSGANQEILKAYEFRRAGDNKNAIIEAAKAFESTMKAICDGLKYPYNPTKDTAKDLIKILEDNSFYPTYMNTHISGIRITLESGAPTVRNKTSGHGQGAAVQIIPDEYVDYTLNLVTTNIVFLAKLYGSIKGITV